MIKVDKAKCVNCGVCTSVCPRGLIKLEANGPEAFAPNECIACGQCVAICPHAALDNARSPLSGQISMTHFSGIDERTAYYFMRSRRSIRSYKKVGIPRDKLLKLMDIARFAPTGGNSQGLSYIVIENPVTLQKIPAIVIDWVEEQIRIGSKWVIKSDARYVKNYRINGWNVVLRDAPCLVIATAPKDFARGTINTRFSLAYVELYATSLGLGSCYAGLFERCVKSGCRPLLDLLNLPEAKSITGALMVGYPKNRYHRFVDRNPLDITFDLP